MAEITEDSLEELDKAVAEVRDFMRNRTGIRGGNNVSTMTLNLGGLGACIALCSCQFVMMVAMGFLYWDQSRKVERMQDYLNSIYQVAPQLKSKE